MSHGAFRPRHIHDRFMAEAMACKERAGALRLTPVQKVRGMMQQSEAGLRRARQGDGTYLASGDPHQSNGAVRRAESDTSGLL